jgi:hypothetical protein
VTIGGLTDPAAGVLLDLNSTGGLRGGLLLSNVAIEDLWKIPDSAVDYFPGIDASNVDVNPSFTGALVCHTGQNNIPAGVYVWNGGNWMPTGDGCRELKLISGKIVLDAQSRVVLENKPVTFTLSGQTPSCSRDRYEWYKKEDGTATFEPTPFAVVTSSTALSIDSFPPVRAVYKVKS